MCQKSAGIDQLQVENQGSDVLQGVKGASGKKLLFWPFVFRVGYCGFTS
jgi:hypothetical protein